MDEDTRREWLDAAADIFTSWTRNAGDVAHRRLRGLVPRVSAALDASGGKWDAAVSASLAAAWVGARRDEGGIRASCEHEVDLHCLRNAWRVVSADLAAVPRGERARVAAMLDRGNGRGRPWMFDDLPPPSVVGRVAGGSVTLPFLVARPSSATSRTFFAVAGEAVVSEVPPGDAPVVATLRPDEGRAGISLRVLAGQAYRPILEPNSWTPASLDRFAEAAASGEAWMDSPWLPAMPCAERYQAVSDVARPRARLTRADAAQDAAFLEAAGIRAGPLVVVDGVVHRPCRPPTLELGMLRALGLATTRPGLRVGWSVGNLHQFSRQETLGPHGSLVDWGGGRDVPFPAFWPAVPLVDVGVAMGLADAVRARCEGDRRGYAHGHVDRPPHVEVHDPTLLPDGTGVATARLVAWAKKAAGGHLAGLADAVMAVDPDVRRLSPAAVGEAHAAALAVVSAAGWSDDAGGTGAMVLRGLDLLAAGMRMASDPFLPADDGMVSFRM